MIETILNDLRYGAKMLWKSNSGNMLVAPVRLDDTNKIATDFTDKNKN
jgi:hypothetical protein